MSIAAAQDRSRRLQDPIVPQSYEAFDPPVRIYANTAGRAAVGSSVVESYLEHLSERAS